MGESYSGIRALADFIRDVTKYQQYTVSLVTDRPGKWTYLPLSLRDTKLNYVATLRVQRCGGSLQSGRVALIHEPE